MMADVVPLRPLIYEVLTSWLDGFIKRAGAMGYGMENRIAKVPVQKGLTTAHLQGGGTGKDSNAGVAGGRNTQAPNYAAASQSSAAQKPQTNKGSK